MQPLDPEVPTLGARHPVRGHCLSFLPKPHTNPATHTSRVASLCTVLGQHCLPNPHLQFSTGHCPGSLYDLCSLLCAFRMKAEHLGPSTCPRATPGSQSFLQGTLLPQPLCALPQKCMSSDATHPGCPASQPPFPLPSQSPLRTPQAALPGTCQRPLHTRCQVLPCPVAHRPATLCPSSLVLIDSALSVHPSIN